MKKKINLKNILNYIKGYSRYYRYIFTKKLMKKYKFQIELMPTWKKEQFEERLLMVNKECLLNGKCVQCGCDTPQLFMIEGGCEGGCYEDMLNIQRLIGTEKIQRKNIHAYIYSTGMLRIIGGILNIVRIVGIPSGIKMLSGNIAVNVQLRNGNKSRFFLTKEEYLEFKNIA